MATRDWYCEDVLSGRVEVRRIYEDDLVLAFHHPRPDAEVHAVVVPKNHVASLLDPAVDADLLASILRAVREVARTLGLEKRGFVTRVNTGAPGVTPHLHWHVTGPGVP